MKVCQIKNAANLLVHENLPEGQGVNFIVWRNTNYVTLTFMANDGNVLRYRIYEDNRVESDEL